MEVLPPASLVELTLIANLTLGGGYQILERQRRTIDFAALLTIAVGDDYLLLHFDEASFGVH